MSSVLFPFEIKLIEDTLPPQFAALKDKYPYAVLNTADYWAEPPFPQGYVPYSVDVYYGDDVASPDIAIEDGKLTNIRFPEELEAQLSQVVQIEVDGRWAFIQVEGIVLLNHLEGVLMPDVLIDTSTLIKAAGLLNG